MSLTLVLIAIILAAASGVPGLCLARTSRGGERIATLLCVAASILGLAGAAQVLFTLPVMNVALPCSALVESVAGIDALSAFFLVPVFLMGGLGAIYGLGYWSQLRHLGSGRKLRVFWGILVAGMATMLVSKHALLFLVGWEMMALAAFFLVSTEDQRAECRKAGWIYLIATHVGTLSLIAFFALWRWSTGSYELRPLALDEIDLTLLNALFFLAWIGFGLKAGSMPLHFWLPPAHASAPTHVSAMLSGVVIKMGIYGLLRFLALLPAPPAAWGWWILAFGSVSGVLGVAFAIGQHDLKRLLAYHSVENIGIILMGMGLAMLGRSAGRPEWVVLGLAACLLHTWNHCLFKSLLFLCAGSVIHVTHRREIDHLGGLAKSMPWTAALFLVGAVAICGLPPLNGFVSELLVYLGLLQTAAPGGESFAAAVIAAPLLAMTGALAVACFVKVYGAVFLGTPRSSACAHAHDPPASMKIPMLCLAACCAFIGLAPVLVAPVLDLTIASWLPGVPGAHGSSAGLPVASLPAANLASLAPLGAISTLALLLTGLIGFLAAVATRRGVAATRSVTWDCGYARPTARMQYTSSSFAQMVVALFRWVLRPRVHTPLVAGAFPRPARMHSHVDDLVLDGFLLPAGGRIERGFRWCRRFQQGLTQHYLLYILITVVVMLCALMPIGDLLARLFAR